MKQLMIGLVVVALVILGATAIYTSSKEGSADGMRTYSNDTMRFSLRIPEGYTADEHYTYQFGTSTIPGVKFTIPESLATSTNLSADTYISFEQIPNVQECTTKLFLPDAETGWGVFLSGRGGYSVATSTGAAAGNRYEETVYVFPGTAPCVAVRYFIHYSVFENYPAGTVQEFDKEALLYEFNRIRGSLVVN